MKRNYFFINGALVTGSLLLFFCLFEIYLRIINFNPFGEFFAEEGRAIFIQPSKNPQKIYEAKPNAKGLGWETQISINSYGFRGKEYPLKKPSDTKRIIVLGDSVTFGNRLAADENYPSVLEKFYQQANKKVEVLNLGLGGYDSLQEVAALQDIGLKFSPDLVILGYCINDIGIASGNANYIKRLQTYGSSIYKLRIAQFIRIKLDRILLQQENNTANKKEVFEKTYKDYMAEISNDKNIGLLMADLENSLKNSSAKQPFTWDYTDSSKIKRLRFALEQLKSMQYKQGEKQFDVIVIIFPFLLENINTRPIFQRVYKIVSYEMERLDFQVLNLYPLFNQYGFNRLMIKQDDGIHPNAMGHHMVAEALFEQLEHEDNLFLNANSAAQVNIKKSLPQ